MPRFLAELAQALEHGPGAKAQAFIQTPREHGEQRASLEEYSLEEVIKEYQYLRRAGQVDWFGSCRVLPPRISIGMADPHEGEP
jgi:hypothetical protein